MDADAGTDTGGILCAPDGTFIYEWLQLSDSERSAIGEPGFSRYRNLVPEVGATIHNLSSKLKQTKHNGDRDFVLTPDDPSAAQTAPPLNWQELERRGEPPARRWAINGWLGFGHVSLLVGPGGIGKTLIAQQAASCLALGAESFIGEIPGALTTLMWCCEDDHDELWRRQVKIAKWQNVGLSEFTGGLILEPRVGLDNALFSAVMGQTVQTSLMGELREQAEDYRADVVILDNVGQLYGANENDRHSVTRFINALVGVLPGRAILLLAHPSRGLNSEFSGSSAWENCARTRLYLGDKLPDAKFDEGDPIAGVRYIARRKSNYSVKDYRRMTFADGVLLPDAEEQGNSGLIDNLRAKRTESIVLDGLTKLSAMHVRTVDSKNSPAFLPTVLIEYKMHDGRTKRELADAMRQIMLSGGINKGIVGRYDNRSPMQGLIVSG